MHHITLFFESVISNQHQVIQHCNVKILTEYFNSVGNQEILTIFIILF